MLACSSVAVAHHVGEVFVMGVYIYNSQKMFIRQ